MDKGEVKWFDGVGKEAESKAQNHWRTSATEKPEVENLGSSFFDTKSSNALDNYQMDSDRKEYLMQSAIKLGKEAGVDEGKFGINANIITYDFLKENFMGDSNKSSNSSGGISGELLQIVWDYGGSDYAKDKLPKNIFMTTIFRGMDTYLSSENLGVGSDRTSGLKADARRDFNTKMPSILTKSNLIKIRLHKF